MSDMIELVRFRLRQGRTAAEWLDVNEMINEWLRTQSGFRMRSLSETEDGEWIDILCWESVEAAEAASERFGDEIGAFCEPMIDLGSIKCSHGKSHLILQR